MRAKVAKILVVLITGVLCVAGYAAKEIQAGKAATEPNSVQKSEGPKETAHLEKQVKLLQENVNTLNAKVGSLEERVQKLEASSKKPTWPAKPQPLDESRR